MFVEISNGTENSHLVMSTLLMGEFSFTLKYRKSDLMNANHFDER